MGVEGTDYMQIPEDHGEDFTFPLSVMGAPGGF